MNRNRNATVYIRVTLETKRLLDAYRSIFGVKTYDETIRKLIERYEHAREAGIGSKAQFGGRKKRTR